MKTFEVSGTYSCEIVYAKNITAETEEEAIDKFDFDQTKDIAEVLDCELIDELEVEENE